MTNTITEQWLKDNAACEDGIDFVVRNKLIGFPFNLIDDIDGDYEGYIEWVKDNKDNTLEYDDNCLLVRYVGNDHYPVNFKYDDNNNLIEKTFDYNELSHVYEYDDNNNLIFEQYPFGLTCNYKYDKNNNRTMCITHDKYGKHVSLKTYQYNDSHVLTYENYNDELEEFYTDGKLTLSKSESDHIEYEYENNNVIRVKRPNINLEDIYEYDSHNNILSIKKILNNVITDNIVFTNEYYADGQLKSITRIDNGIETLNLTIPFFEKV
jgi:YD repeat-containing protein